MITPTETNNQQSSNSQTSNTQTSTSTSSSGSSNQPKYDVKTGTMKEFSEGNEQYNWDPFADMKVLTEDQKILKEKILDQYNAQRAKIEEAYLEQKAILEKQK